MKINAVTVQNEVDTTHRRIAFMRGQPFNSDSEDRWKSIVEVSREMGITIDPKLVVQLEKDISSPELGYPVTAIARAASSFYSCGRIQLHVGDRAPFAPCKTSACACRQMFLSSGSTTFTSPPSTIHV